MKKLFTAILITLFFSSGAQNQIIENDSVNNLQDESHSLNKEVNYSGRKWLIGGLSTAVYGGSFIYLNEAWYKDYQRTSFHTFNDIGEWQQVDKLGHAWTAYHTSRINSRVWNWAGVSQNNAVLLGTGTSLLYMFGIEYLDGLSAEWGWSWADVSANIAGASLFALQELSWKDQRISLKFSSFNKSYSGTELNERANTLFGAPFHERLLKDYNAQTYWLSFNLSSFLRDKNLPLWLNVSIGYGTEGMFGGYENVGYDKTGNINFDRRDIKRYRQWYLAPDVDLTKIRTRSKFLKTAFSALNVLKFPAPALEYADGKFKVKGIVF